MGRPMPLPSTHINQAQVYGPYRKQLHYFPDPENHRLVELFHCYVVEDLPLYLNAPHSSTNRHHFHPKASTPPNHVVNQNQPHYLPNMLNIFRHTICHNFFDCPWMFQHQFHVVLDQSWQHDRSNYVATLLLNDPK